MQVCSIGDATEKIIITENPTYSVKREADNGSSNPSSSTSNKPLKIGSFLIPRKPKQLLSISIVSTKINRFEWSCPQNIHKVAFPKSSQPLRRSNFANKLEYAPLLTTDYVLQLKPFKWSHTSSDKTKQNKINKCHTNKLTELVKLNIPRDHSGYSTGPEMFGGVDGIASSYPNLSLLNDTV